MKKLLDTPYLKWLTLFLSTGTLLCCALPILLVSLGFGSVVASLFFHSQTLSFLAEHKTWTLIISFIFLTVLAWIIYRPNQSCPTDKEAAKNCTNAKRYNKIIFLFSCFIWFVGFFASTLLLPLKNLLGA